MKSPLRVLISTLCIALVPTISDACSLQIMSSGPPGSHGQHIVPLPPQGNQAARPPTQMLSDLRSRLFARLNEHRRAQGLSPLDIDPMAQRAAQLQAEDMQRNGIMRHYDSAGRSPIDRFSALGGNTSLYAENIGFSPQDPENFTDQQAALSDLDRAMMSEQFPNDGHRGIVLSDDFGAVGIGISAGSHGLFVAEDFVGSAAQQYGSCRSGQ